MMVETSKFWDGIALGDATTAPYSSDEYARVQRDLIRASGADSGPLLGTGVAPDLGLTARAPTPDSPGADAVRGGSRGDSAGGHCRCHRFRHAGQCSHPTAPPLG